MQRSRDQKKGLPEVCSSEIGFIGEAAHKLENHLDLRIVARQGVGAYETVSECAHLTVVMSRNVKAKYAKYHSRQSGHARSQVDLPKPKGAGQSRAQGCWVTKPNRKRVSLQTHIVQPQLRRPRMTLHS